MAGLLSNAVSGLQASQTALRTAGHNISNANTAGYSRQTVESTARLAQVYGNAGYLGNGVSVASIERVVNEFVNTQLRLDTSAYNQLNSYNTNISKLDSLLADPNTGLAGAVQNLFQALHNAADDPSSLAARQLVITQNESLAVRFNTLYARFEDIGKGVKSEISTVVSQVAALAQSVAKLNQSIANNSTGAAGGPNDLLDQRDEALRKLSELVSVQLVPADSGAVNVFVGNGEPLVVGPNVSQFTVDNTGAVLLDNGKTKIDITAQLKGGRLGGLIDFRDNALGPTQNELGRIALAMADQFNRLQAQGLDLDGEFGGPMFANINSEQAMFARVEHSSNNKPPLDRVLSVKIADTNQLTASDYQFAIAPNTNNYSVVRESDGVVVAQGLLSGSYPTTISFDGVELNLTSGSFTGGDKFTIKPTAFAARDIQSILTRPEDLAFAVPVRTLASSANSGSGVISAGSILSQLDAAGNTLPLLSVPGQLSPPIVIRFTSATTYDVLDNTDPANPVDLVPPMREQIFTPGVENQIFTQDPGETRIIGQGARLGLPAGRLAMSPVTASTLAQPNGYPAERYTFSWVDPATGLTQNQSVTTQNNASAAQIAAQLSAVPGVSANAYTNATISGINIDQAAFTSPLQITINGEPLLGYSGGNLASDIPNPNTDPVGFNDYLASRINSNSNLQALGLRATSGNNPITGAPEIKMVASSGVNLDIRFNAINQDPLTSAPLNSSISVNDGSGNPDVVLAGVNNPATVADELSAVTVGGRVDLTLAGGISFASIPTDSQIFGDTSAANFAQSSYLGLQVSITGKPKAGDTFEINYNQDATNDNRNALALAALETAKSLGQGSMSFAEGYARLVEEVGTEASQAKINAEASKSLLDQTQALRDSYSGVNLDEEAADLIKFQQLYSANAQVISVARELFDTLLQSI